MSEVGLWLGRVSLLCLYLGYRHLILGLGTGGGWREICSMAVHIPRKFVWRCRYSLLSGFRTMFECDTPNIVPAYSPAHANMLA